MHMIVIGEIVLLTEGDFRPLTYRSILFIFNLDFRAVGRSSIGEEAEAYERYTRTWNPYHNNGFFLDRIVASLYTTSHTGLAS